jgi:hypothetical protein
MEKLDKTTGAKTSRSETVGVRLDPKLRYLAEIAARENQRTLSGFIEWAIRKTLLGQPYDEPSVTEPTRAQQDRPLWNEGLWDVDAADRFFLLATARPGLLTIQEQRLWKLFNLHMEHTKRKLGIAEFRKFWNDPSINTSHLDKGDK